MGTYADAMAVVQPDDDDPAAYFAGLQALIDSGSAWHLEGSVGRAAMAAIENGDCILGPVGHRDYFGNYVPSRTEVKAGTKGSAEYARRMRKLAEND